MSTEVPCYWLLGLDWIRATFTLCTTRFRYLSIITGFLWWKQTLYNPQAFPLILQLLLYNIVTIQSSNAYKKFDPTGSFRIFVCEHSCWVIWVEYLCFSFPMYLLLWANHQHVINIHLHVEKLSVRDIPYSFFFPRPYTTIIVQCFTTFWPGNVV